MKALTLEVPDHLAQQLDKARGDFVVRALELGLRQHRIEQALEQYKQGGMSLGAAAHKAGVTKSEMARQAYAYGLQPPYSEETLAEELGTAEKAEDRGCLL